ncbi:MAG: winged helix-turn-helix domain-containing protein [Pirellulaceae bacterium]|nr:winged helix-turn-helix domain-containing protein [Pirellulaceae bacterium]
MTKKKRSDHVKSSRSANRSPVASQHDPTSPSRTSNSLEPAHRSEHAGGRWTFLTNHSHVLILLSRNPTMVLREVAALVGITERAVQRIIVDLEQAGYIEREKVGRQNQYRILADRPLRHPIESHRKIGDIIALIESSD